MDLIIRKKKIKDNANTANEVKNYTEGQHQLELSKEEKDMITFAKNNYSKAPGLLTVDEV